MQGEDLTPITSVVEVLRGQLATQHSDIGEIKLTLSEVCGRDGRHGIVKSIGDDVREMTDTMRINQRAIQQLQQQQENQSVKLTLLVGGAATVATIVGAGLFKLLGG